MKKHVAFILLLVFLSLTLFIDFFHTEKALRVTENCPACHFQNSIPNQSQYDFHRCLDPPQLLLLDMPFAVETICYNQVFLGNPTSRGPPKA
jgi:hypothetical protein